MPNKPPPKTKPKPKRTATATIYVLPEVKRRLRAIAGLLDLSVGELVAKLLAEYQARK